MGSADRADGADLHGPRLETLLERLVDTPVRGVVYEAAGTVEPALLGERRRGRAGGGASAGGCRPRSSRPIRPTTTAWLAAMTAAVERLL